MTGMTRPYTISNGEIEDVVYAEDVVQANHEFHRRYRVWASRIEYDADRAQLDVVHTLAALAKIRGESRDEIEEVLSKLFIPDDLLKQGLDFVY